jgi:hypothetical protein
MYTNHWKTVLENVREKPDKVKVSLARYVT